MPTILFLCLKRVLGLWEKRIIFITPNIVFTVTSRFLRIHRLSDQKSIYIRRLLQHLLRQGCSGTGTTFPHLFHDFIKYCSKMSSKLF